MYRACSRVSGCASKKWQLAGIQPTIILQDGVVWESVALQLGHGNDDDGNGDDGNDDDGDGEDVDEEQVGNDVCNDDEEEEAVVAFNDRSP